MLALLCFESKNNGGGKTTTSSFWRAQPNVCSSKICLPFWLDFSWTQELEAPWPAPARGLTSELNEHSFLCWWQTLFCCFKVHLFFSVNLFPLQTALLSDRWCAWVSLILCWILSSWMLLRIWRIHLPLCWLCCATVGCPTASRRRWVHQAVLVSSNAKARKDDHTAHWLAWQNSVFPLETPYFLETLNSSPPVNQLSAQSLYSGACGSYARLY